MVAKVSLGRQIPCACLNDTFVGTSLSCYPAHVGSAKIAPRKKLQFLVYLQPIEDNPAGVDAVVDRMTWSLYQSSTPSFLANSRRDFPLEDSWTVTSCGAKVTADRGSVFQKELRNNIRYGEY